MAVLGFRTNKKTKHVFPLGGGAPVNLVIAPPVGMSQRKKLQSLFLVPKQKAREAIDEQKRGRLIKKLDLEKRKRLAKTQAESQENRQEINRLLAIENARSGIGTVGRPKQRGLVLTDIEEQRRLKPILPARTTTIGKTGVAQAITVESSGKPKTPRKASERSALAGIITATAPSTTILTASGRSVRATGLGTLPMGTTQVQTDFPSPRGSLPRGFIPQKQMKIKSTPTVPQQTPPQQQPSTVKEKVKKDQAEAKIKKRKLNEQEKAEIRKIEAESEILKEEKRVTAQIQAQNRRDEEKILLEQEIARQNVQGDTTELGTDAGSINRLLLRKGGIEFL